MVGRNEPKTPEEIRQERMISSMESLCRVLEKNTTARKSSQGKSSKGLTVNVIPGQGIYTSGGERNYRSEKWQKGLGGIYSLTPSQLKNNPEVAVQHRVRGLKSQIHSEEREHASQMEEFYDKQEKWYKNLFGSRGRNELTRWNMKFNGTIGKSVSGLGTALAAYFGASFGKGFNLENILTGPLQSVAGMKKTLTTTYGSYYPLQDMAKLMKSASNYVKNTRYATDMSEYIDFMKGYKSPTTNFDLARTFGEQAFNMNNLFPAWADTFTEALQAPFMELRKEVPNLEKILAGSFKAAMDNGMSLVFQDETAGIISGAADYTRMAIDKLPKGQREDAYRNAYLSYSRAGYLSADMALAPDAFNSFLSMAHSGQSGWNPAFASFMSSQGFSNADQIQGAIGNGTIDQVYANYLKYIKSNWAGYDVNSRNMLAESLGLDSATLDKVALSTVDIGGTMSELQKYLGSQGTVMGYYEKQVDALVRGTSSLEQWSNKLEVSFQELIASFAPGLGDAFSELGLNLGSLADGFIIMSQVMPMLKSAWSNLKGSWSTGTAENGAPIPNQGDGTQIGKHSPKNVPSGTGTGAMLAAGMQMFTTGIPLGMLAPEMPTVEEVASNRAKLDTFRKTQADIFGSPENFLAWKNAYYKAYNAKYGEDYSSKNNFAYDLIFPPLSGASDVSLMRAEYEAAKAEFGELIPGYKNGLASAPYNNYYARLHRGEMVLTGDVASYFRNHANLLRDNGVDYSGKMSDSLKNFVKKDDPMYSFVPIDDYYATLSQGDMVLTKRQADKLRYNPLYLLRKAKQEAGAEGVPSSVLSLLGSGSLAAIAMKLISANEGSYTSINQDDVGATSIGKFQWRGGRAYGLLRAMYLSNPALFDSVGSPGLTAKMKSGVSWGKYVVTDYEKAVIRRILGTEAFKPIQDNQMVTDYNSYISHGKGLGITDPRALILYSDLENNFGRSGVAKLVGSYLGYDEMYQHVLSRQPKKQTRMDRIRRGIANYIAQYGPIPAMAEGGIATGPTIMVGEGSRNEAVIPLNTPEADKYLAKSDSEMMDLTPVVSAVDRLNQAVISRLDRLLSHIERSGVKRAPSDIINFQRR